MIDITLLSAVVISLGVAALAIWMLRSPKPLEVVARALHGAGSVPLLGNAIELLSRGLLEAAVPFLVSGLILLWLAFKDLV